MGDSGLQHSKELLFSLHLVTKNLVRHINDLNKLLFLFAFNVRVNFVQLNLNVLLVFFVCVFTAKVLNLEYLLL